MSSSGHRSRRASKAYGIKLDKRAKRSRSANGTRVSGWERALQAIGLGFVAYVIRRTGSALGAVLSSSWLLSLPFAALLMLTSVDFLVLTSVNDSINNLFFDELGLTVDDVRRDDAELFKTQVLQYLYIALLLLTVVHWREVYGYFKQWPHLILIMSVLLFGALYSIEPLKVLTNAILIMIGFMVAILFSLAHATRRNFRAFYVAVFLPMLVLHVASFFIFLEYDRDIIDFVFSSRRYGGLAGNPNSLGATAVLGYWAAGCLVLSRSVGVVLRGMALLALPLFVLHIVMSGSGTAISAIVLVTIALFWLRILAAFKSVTRQALNAGAAVLLVLLLIAVVISSTPADLYLSFTESLGKDASLTGRTELWDVARHAISLRPYFGWGFDSHTSVMAEGAFAIEFNHYHNGFLDTLVAGGAVLLVLVLYNLLRFVRAFFVAFDKDSNVFPLVVPLIMLLFLNLSEYSLLRPNSQIWTIYIVSFVMLTFHQRDRLLSKISSARRKGGSGRQKRQLRWA